MKRPEDVQLSREEGEALIERIERNALSAELCRTLADALAEQPPRLWRAPRADSAAYLAVIRVVGVGVAGLAPRAIA